MFGIDPISHFFLSLGSIPTIRFLGVWDQSQNYFFLYAGVIMGLVILLILILIYSIQTVYEITGDAGDKRKKLPLGSNVSNKIDGIFVLCKNFRFLRFSFKFAGVDTGRNITNALLHHSR